MTKPSTPTQTPPPQSSQFLLPALFLGGLGVGALIVWGLMTMQPRSANVTPAGSNSALTVPGGQQATPSTEQPTSTETIPAVDQMVATTTTPIPAWANGTTDYLTSFSHPADLSHGSLAVTWLSKPETLATTTARTILAAYATDTSDFDRNQDSVNQSANGEWTASEWYLGMSKLGTVNAGQYAGASVYLFKTQQNAPQGPNYDLLVVPFAGPLIYLPMVSPTYPSIFTETNAVAMPNLSVPSLNVAPVLHLLGGRPLTLDGAGGIPPSFYGQSMFQNEMDPADAAQFVVATTTQEGVTLYRFVSKATDTTSKQGCAVAVLPDGQIVRYHAQIPQKDGKHDLGIIPNIIWEDAYKNSSSYNDTAYGGCGVLGCSDVVSDADVGPMSGLLIAGHTSDGDEVYVPANPTKSPLVKKAYDTWFVTDGVKPSLTAFVKKYPAGIVLWKNPLGWWVRLTTTDVMPQVECGKPVIYLYPTKTTDVSVRLPSFINVTKSVPSYPARGWNVTARPDGSLISSADGKNYGSLYWEGTGVAYQAPTSGFVIKDGAVDESLVKILAQYGLNAQESKDYREFWVPKMVGAPYYRVSFLTSEWSAAAPLAVTPRPTTQIRLFMDWQKLNAPMSLARPTIVTPKRVGFTLVEWGGLLHE